MAYPIPSGYITKTAVKRCASAVGISRMHRGAMAFLMKEMDRFMTERLRVARLRLAQHNRVTLRKEDVPPYDATPPRTFPKPPLTEASATDEKKTCSVCLDRPRCVVAIPCGHVYSCLTCASKRPKTCAHCRKRIQSMYRVYKV